MSEFTGNLKFDNRECSGGNFTIVYNAIFRDDEIRPEAKGAYCQLCSEGPWFVVTAENLSRKFHKCSKDRMCGIISELIAHGYITRTHEQDPETGQYIGYTYVMHKDPKGLIIPVDGMTVPAQEEPKDKPKGERTKAEIRHKYGEFKHVMLTDAEREKIIAEHGEELLAGAIKEVDEYCEREGKTYKNYALVIKRWGLDAAKEKTGRRKQNAGSTANSTGHAGGLKQAAY